MELGALVCTPRSPQCLICPVRMHCQAQSVGVQEAIPAPRPARQVPLLRRRTYCIQAGDRWLIEQRPPRGRWAGMWQFLTIDPNANGAAELPVSISRPRRLGLVTHTLTHRRYEFEVFRARAKQKADLPSAPPRRWATLEALDRYPLPAPHLRIRDLLRPANPNPPQP